MEQVGRAVRRLIAQLISHPESGAQRTVGRRLMPLLGPVDVVAVKCQVWPLLRMEATHIALGIKPPLEHEALDPFIRAQNGSVIGEADPAFVEQPIRMRREE
jgi:hypothetical protein